MGVYCRRCMAAYHREYNQRPEVKKRQAERALAAYHKLTPEQKLELQGNRYKRGPRLQALYKMSIEDYEEMLTDQGGGCAICGKSPSPKKRLNVDHDHACCPGEVTCGKCVRGLLCTPCNVFLGYFENKDTMSKMKAYVRRTRG